MIVTGSAHREAIPVRRRSVVPELPQSTEIPPDLPETPSLPERSELPEKSGNGTPEISRSAEQPSFLRETTDAPNDSAARIVESVSSETRQFRITLFPGARAAAKIVRCV